MIVLQRWCRLHFTFERNARISRKAQFSPRNFGDHLSGPGESPQHACVKPIDGAERVTDPLVLITNTVTVRSGNITISQKNTRENEMRSPGAP
jgi:hypothetical protein